MENSVEYAVTAPKRCEQLGEIPVDSEITFFTAGWGNLVALDIMGLVSAADRALTRECIAISA
ncbi:hypothetical protein [Corynebacterium ulcerans]|uniref:hypothetical protein n=1 Tax=Corynebacterium ulcerans TaxID=65058 RepID=UPI0002FF366C|nr:hypothetical protein [Corynebacterium ulcerans]